MAKRLCGAMTLALFLMVPSWARDKRSEPTPEAAVKSAKSTGTQTKAATLSTANYENFKNLSIAAGDSVTIDSNIDFSAADRVMVAVRAASGSSVDDLVLMAYWTVPTADYYNTVEYALGEEFSYSTAGGASFNVFGTKFRLILVNDGKSTINLQQVTIYVRLM